jgi:hypothetical protein
MKRKPTFEQLSAQRELPVINPTMGARFTISLRGWQDALSDDVAPDGAFENDGVGFL